MKNLLVIGVSLAVSTAFAYTVSGKADEKTNHVFHITSPPCLMSGEPKLHNLR